MIPKDAYGTFSRHKKKVAALFAIILAATAAAAFLWPKEYRSEAELLVRLGRENSTLDPTATLGQGSAVAIPSSRDAEINSVAEVLKSRVLIERAVDAVGAAALTGAEEEDGAEDDAAVRAPLRDKAVRLAARQLDVGVVKRSNIVRVAYDGPSPDAAQAFVAALTEAFLEQHGRLNRPPGARQFLDDQTRQLRADLAAKEEKLRDVKNRMGFADVPIQRKILLERIGRLEDDSLQASAAVKTAEAQVRTLREKLAELPPRHISAETKGRGDLGTDGMRQQYYALRLKEQEMAALYTTSHPKMQEVRDQVQAAAAILKAEEPTRTEVTTAPSRPHEETSIALLREQASLVSLEAKARAIQAQLADARSQLEGLNENELQVARLQREVDLQEAHYRKYSQALEQTRIDEALGAEKISNIAIVQPATYDLRPVRPRKALTLGLGLMAAILGSLGLLVLAEALDPAVKRAEHEEQVLPARARSA